MAYPLDPMIKTYEMASPQVSKTVLPIAGIQCAIYGLDELPPQSTEVSCLYCLHARGVTMASMDHVARMAVADWNQRLRQGRVETAQQNKGLIAVCLDQRNHGSREVEKLSNEAWRSGNPRHAQDMWAIFNGTARDTSNLIEVLDCYVFPKADRKITNNLVLGVSLGAHAAWNIIMHEPRVKTGIIVVGCPDYVNLMADRARLSKLDSWRGSDPPGSEFLGSPEFPHALLELIKRYDPAGLLFNQLDEPSLSGPVHNGPVREPTEDEKRALRPVLQRTLAGKKILNLAGGADKLVPYHRGEPFLTWLKKAIAPGGWFADGKISLDDRQFEGVGHEVTPPMINAAVQFIGETLARGVDATEDRNRASHL